MKKSPAFQFYPDEWLSAREITLMTPAEEGAYIRLLCYCWLDPELSIPDNDDELIVLTRLNKGGLTKVKAKFNQHPTKPGFLTHNRLQKEAQKQAKWREKSSLGGKKSKRKPIENIEENKGGSILVQPKGNSLSPSPSLSLIKKNTKKENQDCMQGFETFWESFPKQRRGSKDKAKSAYTAALNRAPSEEIQKGVVAYARSEEVSKGFAKGAAAWLNDDRWTSDYGPQRKINQTGKGLPLDDWSKLYKH